MAGLLVGAAILGIIIAVMEQDEFPGWGEMTLCILGALIPAATVNLILPPNLFFVGDLVGAVSGAFAISLVTGMGWKRAGIASGLYFAIQVVIDLTFSHILR